MISKQEIMAYAQKLKLSPNIIEKDYVLNWILAGISNFEPFKRTWLFKGGTCLKKCFFKDYRFSEDLDFTLTNQLHISHEFLTDAFYKIAAWVQEMSGLEIPQELIRFDIYNNARGNLSVEGSIRYRGPMQRRGDLAKIKLDLTNDEKIILKPENREVYHPYSDRLGNEININTYCIEEIYAEKLRALMERLSPRDLYDVIHLHNHKDIKPNKNLLLKVLQEKCTFKGIASPSMALLEEKSEKKELISEWEHMLAHQIGELLPMDHYWLLLPSVFDWIYSAESIAGQK